jgi:hypothetical protein
MIVTHDAIGVANGATIVAINAIGVALIAMIVAHDAIAVANGATIVAIVAIGVALIAIGVVTGAIGVVTGAIGASYRKNILLDCAPNRPLNPLNAPIGSASPPRPRALRSKPPKTSKPG